MNQPATTNPANDGGAFDSLWRRVVLASGDALGWPIAFGYTCLIEEQRYFTRRTFVLIIAGMLGQLLLGLVTGLYRRRYRPFSFEEVGAAALSVGLSGLVVLIVDRLANHTRPFGHRCIVATAIAATVVLGIRYLRRVRAHHRRAMRARTRIPVVVLGAGEGGERAIRAMLNSPISPYRPVALLDDDPAKRNLSLFGVRVRGTFADMKHVVTNHHAKAVVVAIPSADTDLLRRMHQLAEEIGVQTLVQPPVQQLVGSGSTAELRSFNDEDVLRRNVVALDMAEVRTLVEGRRVLVTGAGGSIGSELSRQICRLDPQSLVLLDHDDSLLHAVQRSACATMEPFSVLADIRDQARVDEVFATYKPEIVFHAAALKHVPALELAPAEGWKTNVLGTRNVLRAAEAAGVERFVNISTDKAADPINVLGLTKRLGEHLTAAVAQRTGRPFVSVRFGNVIGSRGSVIETFQYQIESGGPVTVTHPDVTRFFMAVREAVRLTLQASVLGAPGEVMVLDMGAPVRILDVARQLVEQSGKRVEIAYTGLRPGEKLHEVLTAPHEVPSRRRHPLIDHVEVPGLWPDLQDEFDPETLRRLVSGPRTGYDAVKSAADEEAHQ